MCDLPPVSHCSPYVIEQACRSTSQGEIAVPSYLYKIVSVENWEKSQALDFLHLSAEDHIFIHFSTEEQLPRILKKYWEATPEGYYVLKVNAHLLPGEMAYEANPGGETKYYHLYRGSIPKISILDVAYREGISK